MSINDWRISYIEKIINHLSDALAEIYTTTTYEIEATRILEKERIIENIIGMGFITCQIYITGTISDANLFSEKKLGKRELMRDNGELIPGTSVTRVELCDAYANYYKHHEDWKEINEKNKYTIQTLESAGIEVFNDSKEMIEAPFTRILEVLLPTGKGTDLSVLIPPISDWRNRTLSKILEKINSYRPTRGCS